VYSINNQPKFRRRRALLATCFMLVSCLSYSSNLKFRATYSSETSVAFQRITQRYVPENITLYNHCCENHKAYAVGLLHASVAGTELLEYPVRFRGILPPQHSICDLPP
jgi:hypothetical protein